MVDTRGRRGFGRVHAEIDRIDDGLQRRRDDTGAARAAGHQPRLAVLQDQGRRHRRQRAFARLDGVGFAANQAVGVGHAGFGREVVHLVVEQDAGAVGDDPATEGKIQCVRDRHRVAFAIDDGVVRGLVALIGLRLTRFDGVGRKYRVRVDAARQIVGVFL